MRYHEHFDHLGNPVYTPSRPSLLHRTVRFASLVVMLGSIAMAIWGR